MERFKTEKRIGIIYPTCPQLPLIWLALLHAGKEPCMLQYPTEKTSAEYWRDSIGNAIQVCELEGLVHGQSLAPFQPELLSKTLLLDGEFQSIASKGFEVGEGAIIQLSSGTTGYRKGIRFTLSDLVRHVESYDQVMQLGEADTIVSWLPLYHDMGFIACFVMPLLKGIPLVLIDPITWIKHPATLFEAIHEHCGTICYMPNFGFEVMARQECRQVPSSMRMWISCSEPTYRPTIEKFCEATCTDQEKVCTCYAMAENVFAVCQSEGLRSVSLNGESVVSCGRTIPGVRIKLVEGEIFVKSDTSITGYLGTGDVRDAEGFYATGDIGGMTGDELYVLGRKRDVMISAGKKYFLNDFDYELGKLFPDSAGRIASLADFNTKLGTQTALFLIEGGRYWDRQQSQSDSAPIGTATGLEIYEAHFVPPFFITKTSSGKINRKKTLKDWKAHRDFVEGRSRDSVGGLLSRDEFKKQVGAAFAGLPHDKPIGESIDSLGGVVLRLLCDQAKIEYKPGISIDEMAGQAADAAGSRDEENLTIVALVDGMKLGFGGREGYITPGFIAELERELGRRVRVEHFAVPPAPILFSDLLFHDFFMPRDLGPKYGAFSSVLQAIKGAGLILFDDEDSLRMLNFCVYPRLTYRFTSHPQADLLAHRLTIYTQNHHLLARDIVAGADIGREIITRSVRQMELYLGTPIMKLAFHADYEACTRDWDYKEYRPYKSDEDYIQNPVDAARIQEAILAYLCPLKGHLKTRKAEPSLKAIMDWAPHLCSFLINPKAVDFAFTRYRSFCIAGLPSSVPYIEKQLRLLGKPFFYSGNLKPTRDDFDCMLCTGFSGETSTQKPYFEFMQIGGEGGRLRNVPRNVAAACPPLAECDPKVVAWYLANRSPMMPVGNMLFNAVKYAAKK
jgi:hypothetical protein